MSIRQTPFLNESKPKSDDPATSAKDIVALSSTASDIYRGMVAFSEFKSNLARRLLILSCSQRKRTAVGQLPALDRYDGPAYQVVRKFLRIYPQETDSLDIYILSAEFGLIAASDLIPNYDRQMNKQRADELRPYALAALRKILEVRMFTQLYINLSKEYFNVLSSYEQFIPQNLRVIVSTGTPGRKLSVLRNWLYGGMPPQLTSQPMSEIVYKAQLRGLEIKLTPDELLQIARQALIEGQGNPDSYQSWYVEVDGRRVAPKWLLSILTGLPVSSFVTDEARHTLSRLGIATHPCD